MALNRILQLQNHPCILSEGAYCSELYVMNCDEPKILLREFEWGLKENRNEKEIAFYIDECDAKLIIATLQVIFKL